MSVQCDIASVLAVFDGYIEEAGGKFEVACSVCAQDIYVFPDFCGAPSNWKEGLRGDSSRAMTFRTIKARPALAHRHF